MSFTKGPVTFQRFKVAGTKPRLFGEEHLDRLHGHRAGRPGEPGAEIRTGWAAGTHVLDAEFTELKNVYPDHLLFDFWVQTYKLPGDRLKAYYEADLKALARENPSGFATARQKREAKESARARLRDEAKDGRWRKWKCVPVAWDALDNTAYFGATSAAQADRFTRLWDETFAANLVEQKQLAGGLSPVTAGVLAASINPAAANEHLSAFVPNLTPEDGPSWCAGDSQDWLGNEFLLWLWWYGDAEGDAVKTPDGGEITFMFSGGVKVEDPRGQTGTGTLNSASAPRLPEAKAAVKAGKLPRKAALTAVRDGEQFSFVLQAETFAVSAARLPPPGDEPTAREKELARLQHVRDLAGILDQLYAAFLARRLVGYWASELKDIQGWLKGGKVKA